MGSVGCPKCSSTEGWTTEQQNANKSFNNRKKSGVASSSGAGQRDSTSAADIRKGKKHLPGKTSPMSNLRKRCWIPKPKRHSLI